VRILSFKCHNFTLSAIINTRSVEHKIDSAGIMCLAGMLATTLKLIVTRVAHIAV